MKYNPHKHTLENHRVFLGSYSCALENDLLIRSVSRFSAKDQFNKLKSSQAHFGKPRSLLSTVARARDKWPLNTEFVTIFDKDLFNEVQSSQAHFWKPRSLFSTVTRASDKWLPNTECVTIFCKDLFNEVPSSQAHSWKPPSLFSTVTRVRSEWPPNTECVMIFYKRSVQWGTILTSAILKTTNRIQSLTRKYPSNPPFTDATR